MFTVRLLAALVAHPLEEVTDTDPISGAAKLTVIPVEPRPDVIVAAAGTVQLYPVAPVTTGTEYAADVNPHVTAGPVIASGNVAATLNAADFDVPVPHAFTPATVILPEVKPVFTILILLVVEVPPNPPGNVH